MLPVSLDFLRTVRSSHERLINASAGVPDPITGVLQDPVPFQIEGGTVTAAYTNGQRYGATLPVAPDDARAWSDLLLTPGALFRVEVQVRTIGGSYETVPLFTGELSAAPQVSVYGGGFSLTMQDQWVRIDRCRYLSPFTTPAATRASIISGAVTGAIPGATVVIGAGVTGSHAGGVVYDKDRTKVITDIAAEADPDLSVGFTADGTFRIDPQPVIDVSSADFTVTDGEEGTIIDFQRVKEVSRLYNTVVLRPATDTQAWTQVVVEVADPAHPRHKNKIGVVPFFYTAPPTVPSRAAAVQVATQVLQAVLIDQSSGKVVAVDNPALEPGDVIAAQMTTGPDTGEVIPALVTSISRNLLAATMELETQAYATSEIEEAS